MGAHDVVGPGGGEAAFLRAVLEDLEVLEELLRARAFDGAPPRMGAEQELVLVDGGLLPARVVAEVLDALRDPQFTVELGRFNLEANLTPRTFGPGVFSALRAELTQLAERARTAAKLARADVVVAGILPTFELLHADEELLTPTPRFEALNRASLASRGGRLPLYIEGADTLAAWNDNIALECGPTSFQVHLQVSPDAFARTFNAALLLAGPTVAACANSSIVGGLRLWHETRIPLLERSADLRTPAQQFRGGRSRTSLGHGWIRESVLEVFRRDLQRFDPVVMPADLESSRAALEAGRVPELKALSTFNGTIWRWVRPCYGITDGKPHLRIENRVIPAGPSIADEVANTAFWLGVMQVLPSKVEDLSARLDFGEAVGNLHAAARLGLNAELRWLDGRRVAARTLLLEELLPMAREGLRAAKIEQEEIDAALSIVEARVRTGRTGAAWMLDSFERLPRHLSRREKAWAIASALKENCWSGPPVHEWPLVQQPAATTEPPVSVAVRTDFISLAPEAPVELALHILSREPVSHVVIERADGTFVGVVSCDELTDARTGATAGQFANPHVAVVTSLHQPARALLGEMRASNESIRVVMRGDFAAGVVFATDLARLTGGDA